MTTSAATAAQAHCDLRHLAPGWTAWKDAARAPFSGATWRAIAQIPIGFVWCLVVGLATIFLTTTFTGLILLVVGLPLLTLELLGVSAVANAERSRLALQLDAEIPPSQLAAGGMGRHWWFGNSAVLRDPRRWAQVGYFALSVPLSVLEFAALTVLPGIVVAAVMLPFSRTDSTTLPAGDWELTSRAFAERPMAIWAFAAAAVVFVWAAPLALQGLAYLRVRLARTLLGPSDAQRATVELTQRVDVLQTTRSQAVDASDAERRRIERDLHDGAQQRLVALGVELGLAKRAADSDPQVAKGALDHAHAEVKEVLSELRDLVRGIHPAVLGDRGLDAALTGLASRSPVPVAVRVHQPDDVARLPQATQAAAYFVAAESLTNIARHSEASAASIDIGWAQGKVHMVIADNGKGGASLVTGGGLDGLRARVAALDGVLQLESPAGQGTTITVVI